MRAPESRDYDDRCETHVSLNIASLGVQEVKKKTWEFKRRKGRPSVKRSLSQSG